VMPVPTPRPAAGPPPPDARYAPAPPADPPSATLLTVVRADAPGGSQPNAMTFMGNRVLGDIVLPGGMTRVGGFQVLTIAASGGVDALTANRPVPEMNLGVGESLSMTLPPDTFAHTREDVTISLIAMRPDGSALPAWLKFNPRTGTFEGTPPPGFKGSIAVKVVARDGEGREAATLFKIDVGQPAQGRQASAGEAERKASSEQGSPNDGVGTPAAEKAIGKMGLSEQLRAMSPQGRMASNAILLSALTKDSNPVLGNTVR